MSASSPLSAAFSTDASGWERPVFQRQIAMLGELAEAGLEAALAIRDQAVAANADGAASSSRIDFGLAYSRAAKAVRMTLALQRRYILDLRFEFRHGEPAPAWDAPAPKTPAHAVDRVSHGLATGGLPEAEAVERLDFELDAYERLEDLIEDLDDDLPEGPFDDIVAKLCKDLGLAPDWPERTEAALAHLPREAAGGGPSAERSEEPMGEGASRKRYPFRSPGRDTS